MNSPPSMPWERSPPTRSTRSAMPTSPSPEPDGKPQNETYYDEYKKILLEELTNKDLAIVYNLNIGHATPRFIIPFGVDAKVNVCKQVIVFNY